MNKYLFIFSLMISPVVYGMNNLNNGITSLKTNSQELINSYHNALVQHFYSHNIQHIDDQGCRFIYDNESGFVYETKEWKKKVEQDNLEIHQKNLSLNYTINNQTISFFDTKTNKHVDCDLVWHGQLDLKEEDVMSIIKKDRESIVAAYRALIQ